MILKLILLAQVANAAMMAGGPVPAPAYGDQAQLYPRIKAQDDLIMKTFKYPIPKLVQEAHRDVITCYKFRPDPKYSKSKLAKLDDKCVTVMNNLDSAIKVATP